MPLIPRGTPQQIDITALSEIINRKANTIRKWERGVLPAHLMPQRDELDRRYWTRSQVFSRQGIIAWMERNDMRPGNTITDKENEDIHIAHLRRPKKLNGHHIRSAKTLAANGKTFEQIVNRIYPRTTYATRESFERALRQVAAEQEFDLPKRKRKASKTTTLKKPKRRKGPVKLTIRSALKY